HNFGCHSHKLEDLKERNPLTRRLATTEAYLDFLEDKVVDEAYEKITEFRYFFDLKIIQRNKMV
ncbi:MAG: hypothetical protein CL826_04280, partial [Crocinitomicaceae bacterium]|nr:hypothetical protein [Crocinitomicaceae bacterium]